MSLGKRPRPSMMRRTASLTEFAPVFIADGGESQPRPNQEPTPQPQPHHQQYHSRERAWSEATAAAAAAYAGAGPEWLESRLAGGVPSPRRSGGGGRRSSADFAAVEMAPFLRACGLCRRRLAPGRDIFMYRGDIAFCSLECRQQQINQDERKEKCSLTSMKKEAPPSTNGSDQSSNGETVAAA